MPFPPALPLQLRPGDLETPEAMVRKRTLAQRSVLRARIILYCADGLAHRQIKRRLNISVNTVLWRRRYEQQGIDGLQDRPRPGRPLTFSTSAAT